MYWEYNFAFDYDTLTIREYKFYMEIFKLM